MIGDLATICVNYFNDKYASGFYEDYPKKDYNGWEFLNDPPQITIYYDYDTGTGQILDSPSAPAENPAPENSSTSTNSNISAN